MHDELIYRIALTIIPNIGDVYAKALVNRFETATAIFQAKKKELQSVEGLGLKRIGSILGFKDFERAEQEMTFINKHKIQPIFLTDGAYPKRLLNCYDSPVLLYYRGDADLNASKMVGIVGTRSFTAYGKNVVDEIVEGLAEVNAIIVSGLAYGIDTLSHKAALKHGLPTIGVLAHGLDRIYPTENASIARQMVKSGGLLTEYPCKTNPDKMNFPTRNRIVAGMCDCVLVIESGIKGGSLITAELANGYNKDVFALPGRAHDARSEGCNYLIKSNKAALITSATDIIDMMGWAPKKKSPRKQRQLFIELTEDEKILVALLGSGEPVSIDDLYLNSKLNGSSVAQALLMLEMQGVVETLPGKMYRMV